MERRGSTVRVRQRASQADHLSLGTRTGAVAALSSTRFRVAQSRANWRLRLRRISGWAIRIGPVGCPWTRNRICVPCSVDSNAIWASRGSGPSSMCSAKMRFGWYSETSTREASCLPPGARCTSRIRVPTPSGLSPSTVAETVLRCHVLGDGTIGFRFDREVDHRPLRLGRLVQRV
jgi:hypothetical protein